MTEETNPAHEAAKIAAQVAADAAKAGTVVETDAKTVVTDLKADVVTAEDAIKTAQAGVETGVAAAKTEVTSVETKVAVGAHGVVSSILADFEKIPSEISAELAEAKFKLVAALGWIEAHFTTAKLPIPTAPGAVLHPAGDSTLKTAPAATPPAS